MATVILFYNPLMCHLNFDNFLVTFPDNSLSEDLTILVAIGTSIVIFAFLDFTNYNVISAFFIYIGTRMNKIYYIC